MKFGIVTPTTGASDLLRCIESVQNQTYDSDKIIHYIFVDGEEFFEQFFEIYSEADKKIKVIPTFLQENTGANGWNGHRVYGSAPFLINCDVMCYLDQDNWYKSNHLESILDTFISNPKADWVYSLRDIHDKNGNFICTDDCESLGKWNVAFENHVDTSCFAIKLPLAIRESHSWYYKWIADRTFYKELRKYSYACTGEYTSCYRLDGNPKSVKKEFFIEGNKLSLQRYGSENNFPWRRDYMIKQDKSPEFFIIDTND